MNNVNVYHNRKTNSRLVYFNIEAAMCRDIPGDM